MKPENKTFIITGGASGLGLATARMLVAAGGQVVIADIRAEADAVIAELGPSSRFVSADVTREQDGSRIIESAQQAFGRIDGLVSCAGIAPSERVVGRGGPRSLDNFIRAVSVNLIGTFNMLRLTSAAMMTNEPSEEGERGVIINTASIAAYDGQIGQAAYAASKAGVVGLTLPAARELARYGIRVVTIAPGLFMTPLMAAFPQQVQDTLAQSVPFPPRLGRPEEFAQLVASVIENPMLNGETIRLDGALRMAPK